MAALLLNCPRRGCTIHAVAKDSPILQWLHHSCNVCITLAIVTQLLQWLHDFCNGYTTLAKVAPLIAMVAMLLQWLHCSLKGLAVVAPLLQFVCLIYCLWHPYCCFIGCVQLQWFNGCGLLAMVVPFLQWVIDFATRAVVHRLLLLLCGRMVMPL